VFRVGDSDGFFSGDEEGFLPLCRVPTFFFPPSRGEGNSSEYGATFFFSEGNALFYDVPFLFGLSASECISSEGKGLFRSEYGRASSPPFP